MLAVAMHRDLIKLVAAMTTDHVKIQAGAAAYLELFNDGPGKTEELLELLRSKLGWSHEEILALQTCAVEILLARGATAASSFAVSQP